MPRQYPIVVRKVTQVSSGSVPTAEWDEVVHTVDTKFDAVELEPDALSYGEVGMHLVDMPPDFVQTSDGFYVPTGSADIPDIEQLSEKMTSNFTWTAPARSGSPNNDPWGDAWVDSSVGQTNTNHGNDPALHIAGNPATLQAGWIEVDLTRLSGVTPSSNSFNIFALKFHITSNPNVAATVLTFSSALQSSRPFTESTITQSNAPASPSQSTNTLSIPAGATGNFTVGLGFGTGVTFPNWLVVRISGPSTQTGAIQIGSRENANPPSLVVANVTV